MKSLLRRLLFLGRARQFDDDLDAELRFHLDMRARALEADGHTAADARRQARREVGGVLQIREASRDAWAFRWWDVLKQDVRYAFRGIRRQPAFAAAVIGTLALGIGANTAIFSVVDALLLRSAPFADSGRLVLVNAARPAQQQMQLPLSFPNFVDLRTRARAFDGIAAWTLGESSVSGQADPEQIQHGLVTANLFAVLGVEPTIGRSFRPDEDRAGTAKVVIISHGLWLRRFAGDAGVLGQTLLLDGAPHEVVGVLPRAFHFAGYPHETDVWLPFGLDTFADRQYARGLSTIWAVGRLRAGITIDQARADVAAVASALEQDYPEFNAKRQMTIVTLQEQASANVRWALLALSAGVVLVLLVACANVVNLLLARASARQHEVAVRTVLGGSQRRIAAQLLTEYVVLALAGGVIGLGVAWLARGVLVRLPYNTPDLFTPWVSSLDGVRFDGRVLVFTLATSVIVGLLVGVWPAIRGSNSDQAVLVAGGARMTGARRVMRLRAVLVVAEIAIAVVLLVAMGLMLATVLRLQRVDPGFTPEGVVAADVHLPASRYPGEAQVAGFYADVLARIARQPGVSEAAAAEYLPFSGLDSDTGLLFEGQPIPTGDKRPRMHYRSVTDGYFTAMRIATIAGRSFGPEDRAGSTRVAILNETAARELFPDGRVLGRRVALDFEAMRFYRDRAPDFDLALGLREVVGIVSDVRHGGLAEHAMPEMFVPFPQRPVRRMTLVVTSSMAPPAAMAAIRSAVTGVDARQPLARATTLPDLIAASMARPRFNTTLVTAFGLLALALAAIGIYGVMSYFVALRTRDIGIHMAVGATPADVFRLVTRQMFGLAAAGLMLGLVAALAAGSGLSTLLFNVQPRDPPLVLGGVTAIVLLTAALATLVPTLRALRIDPSRALRAE